ncbi:MAG: IclR family transcriptional regulator [Veillonellales bacterium]
MSNEINYSYNIASVEKTIRIVELLAWSDRQLTVSEIAKRLYTHTSSADRYLLTLQNLGYVEKDPLTDRFRLTDKIIQLNSVLIANHPLTELYLDTMHTLAYEFETTTHIMAFLGSSTVTLHKDLQTNNLAFNNAFFDPKRYNYCSAPGKLLLSTLSEEELKKYFFKAKFIKFTKTTLISEEAVREDLNRIRERGYSIHDEEWLPGNLTISFPLTVKGKIRGAISLMCDISMKDKMLRQETIDYIKSKLIEPET